MAKTKIEKIKDRVRRDLLDQLERNGSFGTQYTEMVEDYMKFFDVKEKCLNDIKERGPMVPYITANGTENMKKNDSVDMALKTNMQMLKILQAIGIKPSSENGGDEDDEL